MVTSPCENAECGAPASNVCSGCKLVHYCSRECQRLCWPQHRAACRREASMRAAREAAAAHFEAHKPAMEKIMAAALAQKTSRERDAGNVYTLAVGGKKGHPAGVKIGVRRGDSSGKDALRERIEDTEGRGPVLPPGVWRFRNCLRRAYDATEKKVRGVIFPTSRHGAFEHRLDFPEAVTEAEAVEAAERFLSVPHDKVYYEHVKTDLFFNQGRSECFAHADLKDVCGDMRGSLLSDLKYLDDIYLLKKVPGDIYYLGCGS
jgi:hypothetical protein